jgi:hypothetical protein
MIYLRKGKKKKKITVIVLKKDAVNSKLAQLEEGVSPKSQNALRRDLSISFAFGVPFRSPMTHRRTTKVIVIHHFIDKRNDIDPLWNYSIKVYYGLFSSGGAFF